MAAPLAVHANDRDMELIVNVAFLDRLGLLRSSNRKLVKPSQHGRQSGRVVDELPTIHEFHGAPETDDGEGSNPGEEFNVLRRRGAGQSFSQ
jgi:hypothetical protein